MSVSSQNFRNHSETDFISFAVIHALGFYHAHKRTDRDEYLKIIWENVIPGKHYKFEKRTDVEKLTDFGVGYDPFSVMHYTQDALTRNGKNTIEMIDKEKYPGAVGQRDELTQLDVLRIRRMYNCDSES